MAHPYVNFSYPGFQDTGFPPEFAAAFAPAPTLFQPQQQNVKLAAIELPKEEKLPEAPLAAKSKPKRAKKQQQGPSQAGGSKGKNARGVTGGGGEGATGTGAVFHTNKWAYEKIGDEFRCCTCGVMKKSRRVLGTHLNYHRLLDMKRWACSMCGKAFSRRREVERHERTHTNSNSSSPGSRRKT